MNYTDVMAMMALAVSIVAAFFTHFMYRKELKHQGYQLAMGMFIEVDQIFIEHPEMRPYFYESKQVCDELDETVVQRANAIAEMLLDVCELVTDTRLGLQQGDEESWKNYVLGCLANSPVTEGHLLAHPEWHPRTHRLWMSSSLSEKQEN